MGKCKLIHAYLTGPQGLAVTSTSHALTGVTANIKIMPERKGAYAAFNRTHFSVSYKEILYFIRWYTQLASLQLQVTMERYIPQSSHRRLIPPAALVMLERNRVLPPEPHLMIVQFETVLQSCQWVIGHGEQARTGHTNSESNEIRKSLLQCETCQTRPTRENFQR